MKRYFSLHIFQPLSSYPWKLLRVDREEYCAGKSSPVYNDIHVIMSPTKKLSIEFTFIRLKTPWPWKT